MITEILWILIEKKKLSFMCIKNYISKSSHFKTSPIMTFLRDQLWLDNDKNVQTWDETHIIIYCRIFIAKSHHPVHTQSHTHTVYTFRLLIHLSHSPDTHIHTLLAGEGLCGISESFGRAENLTDADQRFYIYQVLFINFFFFLFFIFWFLDFARWFNSDSRFDYFDIVNVWWRNTCNGADHVFHCVGCANFWIGFVSLIISVRILWSILNFWVMRISHFNNPNNFV